MAYELTDLTTLGQLKSLATRTKSELDLTLRTILVSGNTVNFYREKNATASNTPAFHFDFPSELFLDQASTQLVQNFTWSAETYPESTNPNLNGKQVLVLGLKTEAADGTETIAYSFVDLTSLIEIVDIATGDSSKVLSIAENGKTRTITFNISQAAGNMLSANADGLYATTRITGATADHLASFDANGAPVDSGIAKADVQQKVTAVENNVATFDANGFVKDSTKAIADIQTKVTGAVAGNVAIFDASGFVVDSTKGIATDAEVAEMITEVFGASA